MERVINYLINFISKIIQSYLNCTFFRLCCWWFDWSSYCSSFC